MPFRVISYILLAVLPVWGQELSWSSQAVVLENEGSSWARMVHLRDGSWLAAYAVGRSPTRVRVKRSFDRMRTWQFIGEVGEAGRDVDNANLYQRADGIVLLAMRSQVPGRSYRIQVYGSVDNGNSFQYLSTADASENTGGSLTRGVYEPFLWGLGDGRVTIFYANEKHSAEKPAYSQVISERVSEDGGRTWGGEIRAVGQTGASRPGEPNMVAVAGGVALFYEVCGTENCVGHTSFSGDGVRWSGAIGAGIPNTWQNAQAVAVGRLIVASSNAHAVLVSAGDLGEWRDTGNPAFLYGVWPALYLTSAEEIALVMTGAGEGGQAGQYIRFGRVSGAPRRVTPKRWPHAWD